MKGYQLLIKLKELPTVWRQVLVPAGITFRALHYVIQYAMGWQDNHLHEFSSDDDPTVYTDNPEADNNYSHVPLASSSAVKIDAILEHTGKLTYVYDLGDHWEHEIALEEVVDLEHSYPLCVGGGNPALRKMWEAPLHIWSSWRRGTTQTMKSMTTAAVGGACRALPDPLT